MSWRKFQNLFQQNHIFFTAQDVAFELEFFFAGCLDFAIVHTASNMERDVAITVYSSSPVLITFLIEKRFRHALQSAFLNFTAFFAFGDVRLEIVVNPASFFRWRSTSSRLAFGNSKPARR